MKHQNYKEWLEAEHPDVLDEYRAYELGASLEEVYFMDLGAWLAREHPELLEKALRLRTIECGRRCVLELDDFCTQRRVVAWLDNLKSKCPQLKVTLFTLLGPSDLSKLKELAFEDWIDLGLHGWDHFSEWRWGYWEMRHYLEIVEDLGFFMPIFKMPWNRCPRLGALKALKEHDFALASPKRLQWPLFRAFGLPIYKTRAESVWLHPHDLTEVCLQADETEFYFITENQNEKMDR